jgi:signal transduction histidine kinase/ActR/RegA family two-component response regulator/HAMP domain-containing protein
MMKKRTAKMFSGVRMQLVASVFVAIAPALTLEYIVNQPWFWQFAPAWLKQYALSLPWMSFAVGLLALAAAWFGGEHFILRQVRALINTAQRLGKGDLNARTGLHDVEGELGQLAEIIDQMADSLQQRIKERTAAEAQLEKIAAFVRLNPNAALELAADGTISYFNEAALKLAHAVQKKHPRDLLPPDIGVIAGECLATGRSRTSLETKIGQQTFLWSFHPAPASHVVHCYAEDITARLDLETQLRQSQKMESIGQLAAGVAHDFNNMLTIIQGHSSSLLSKPALSPEILDSMQAVYFAAERAAALTRQLLMFSRKNVMQLKPLDLRETVGNMSKMLERLLGETIRLEFLPSAELWLVQGDAGMIEQIVMNLAVNARDAMPRGGSLTIGLETVSIDSAYAEMHPQSWIGDFVRLRVTDTGCGMDDATLTRIFEPFFTTKEVGKGTGLGLATIYGIVKQHDGWIEVTSELGKGSTFEVFFPAGGRIVRTAGDKGNVPGLVAGGNETVLIVEDEPVLRDMARLILEERGYRLLEASSGRDALDVWKRSPAGIDLLLTDIVLPNGISGVDLAGRLLDKQPRLKVVFTSGYTVNEINEKFLLRHNALFLQKPYTHADLAKTIRNCLDQTANAVAPSAAIH